MHSKLLLTALVCTLSFTLGQSKPMLIMYLSSQPFTIALIMNVVQPWETQNLDDQRLDSEPWKSEQGKNLCQQLETHLKGEAAEVPLEDLFGSESLVTYNYYNKGLRQVSTQEFFQHTEKGNFKPRGVAGYSGLTFSPTDSSHKLYGRNWIWEYIHDDGFLYSGFGEVTIADPHTHISVINIKYGGKQPA
ncbi:uncharacterized protein MELLADRAFT_64489 [Melampsora larici-populina 98AG31]|uniref:Secreted protein n=1 Tax=Melampsora larici-populina (strain 98AG31 / pathotype 3-4-7) TaxID=747676 RepID=F4RRN0_MELLP|nr:uncharacterized protein MELLADRAFT_64489 [Melampsora larici-populina 98AG31]EGG04992.1 hypothetical protein MELLADRAFT_64489 [Melampsora larici-populina 98AG31]